jgi:dihydrofolate reductase
MAATLVVSAFVTLDGIMQAPGGPDEDRDGGFEHGGWSVPYFDRDMGGIIDEQFGTFDALLLGRKTYEIFAAAWPQMADENDPVGGKINTMPKYVASRTLTTAEWTNSHLLQGDAAEAVAELKRTTDGVIATQGSAGLLPTLQRHDLVDTYRLLVEPVVLGTGKRLFTEGTAPAALRLTRTERTGSGAVYCVYERAGKPTYDSFEPENYEEKMREIRGEDTTAD